MYEPALLDSKDTFASVEMGDHTNEEHQRTANHHSAAFQSQASFFAWLDQTNASELKRTKTLRLAMTDIDMAPLMDPRALIDPGRRTTIWSLCEFLLLRLQTGLRALPNLTTLTLIPPTTASSAFRQAVYRPFLRSIPTLCPRLKQVDLHDSEETMASLPELSKVAKVTVRKQTALQSVEKASEVMRVPRGGAAAVEFEALMVALQDGRRSVSAPAPAGQVGRRAGLGTSYPFVKQEGV